MSEKKFLDQNGLDYFWEKIKSKFISSFNSRTGAVMPQTGDYTAAMVGAAPSGFGLGTETPKSVSSWDAAIENGFYAAPAPSGIGSGTLWGYTASLAGNYKYQQIFVDAYKTSACRYMIDGKWSPFKWVNPPMVLGVEYRTSEMHNGKPVYKIAWPAGDFPSNTTKTVSVDTGTPGVVNSINSYAVLDGAGTQVQGMYGSGQFSASNYLGMFLQNDSAGGKFGVTLGSSRTVNNTATIFIDYTRG